MLLSGDDTMCAFIFKGDLVKPKKSFWVIAPDLDSKKKLIDDISTAIGKFKGGEA